jgi:hypothetical protein
MTSVFPRFLPMMCLPLFLAACQGGAPVMTKPTVADHVVREDRSYQSAERSALLVHFADIRRQIQKMDGKIVGLQRDVGDLRDKQAAMADRLAQAEDVSTPKATPVKSMPVVQKPTRKPAYTASIPAPITGGPLRVTGVRLGDATDHTRLVFDTSGPTTLTSELDNQEKLLLLTLPKTAWDAARTRSFAGDKRLEGYQVMSGTGPDTQIVFTLRNPVTLGAAVALPPSGSRGHRIYIDLK